MQSCLMGTANARDPMGFSAMTFPIPDNEATPDPFVVNVSSPIAPESTIIKNQRTPDPTLDQSGPSTACPTSGHGSRDDVSPDSNIPARFERRLLNALWNPFSNRDAQQGTRNSLGRSSNKKTAPQVPSLKNNITKLLNKTNEQNILYNETTDKNTKTVIDPEEITNALSLLRIRRQEKFEQNLNRQKKELAENSPTFAPSINVESHRQFVKSWGMRPPPVDERLYTLAKCRQNERKELEAILFPKKKMNAENRTVSQSYISRTFQGFLRSVCGTPEQTAPRAKGRQSVQQAGLSDLTRRYAEKRTFQDLLDNAQRIVEKRRSQLSKDEEEARHGSQKPFIPLINAKSRNQARTRTLDDLISHAHHVAKTRKAQALKTMSARAASHWMRDRHRRGRDDLDEFLNCVVKPNPESASEKIPQQEETPYFGHPPSHIVRKYTPALLAIPAPFNSA